MGSLSGVKKLMSVLGVLVFTLTNLFAQDVTPPPPTTIRSVDVDPATNNISIKWNPSTAVDVAGYRVYKVINGYNTVIGTVGAAASSYNHVFVAPGGVDSSTANPNFWSETFMVTAHDGPNESLLSLPHKTMYLSRIFDPCHAKVLLEWTAYVGWNVYEYQIFASINGGASTMITTVDGTKTNFTHRDVVAGVTYVYYIKAIMLNGDYTSRSNAVSVYTDMPEPPSFLNADYATVFQDNIIRLEFKVDTAADEVAYKILRNKDENLEDFDTIATKTLADLKGDLIMHDDNINTNEVHFYKLIMINTCNVPFSMESNICSNMLVTASANPNLTNDIVWTNYFDWRGGVNFYEVHRILGTDDMKVGTISYGDSVFRDDIKSFLLNPQYSINYNGNNYNPLYADPNDYFEQPVLDGKVCYYIRAAETDNNPYGVKGRSNSNTFCMDLEPVIWIPNAFTPNHDGMNEVFLPNATFVGWQNYQLRIYNRFGEIEFQTSNPREGWDGRNIKGEPVPPGVYVYLLQVTSSAGKAREYRGNISLLK